jgi:hypothetical protein
MPDFFFFFSFTLRVVPLLLDLTAVVEAYADSVLQLHTRLGLLRTFFLENIVRFRVGSYVVHRAPCSIFSNAAVGNRGGLR